jgi:hypothetical protein
MDVLAEPCLARLRQRLGVERLHAAELGVGQLVKIAEDIHDLQKRLDLRFFLCRVSTVRLRVSKNSKSFVKTLSLI